MYHITHTFSQPVIFCLFTDVAVTRENNHTLFQGYFLFLEKKLPFSQDISTSRVSVASSPPYDPLLSPEPAADLTRATHGPRNRRGPALGSACPSL